MRIVGLDLGTHTACVIEESSRPRLVIEWDLSVRRGESNGVRFLRFRRHLEEVLREGADLVAYERPVGGFKSGPAAAVLYGLIAEVEATCCDRKIEYLAINASTIKKRATGKGNSNKEAMVTAARERWPELDVTDDNVADALWVVVCAKDEVTV